MGNDQKSRNEIREICVRKVKASLQRHVRPSRKCHKLLGNFFRFGGLSEVRATTPCCKGSQRMVDKTLGPRKGGLR